MMFTALKVVPSMFLILQTLLALLATSLNIGMAKDIPPASVCYSYSNSDNDRATCHGATCPDGCSWPFITAQNCVPTGPTSSKSTTQTCHIGYWKDGTDGICTNRLREMYRCSGKTTGVAFCTGCKNYTSKKRIN
uniref:Secreted protein n=1 Tax=Phakopsora pachyrhizi TaxID=170000 RepID=A0A0S1MKA7_PHAPC